MRSKTSRARWRVIATALAAVTVTFAPPAVAPRANTTEAAVSPASVRTDPSPAPSEKTRPYRPVEPKKSELHKELAGKRPDFGPRDPITQAWAREQISADEYVDLSLKRLARPADLPGRFRTEGELPSSTGLALAYALDQQGKASPEMARAARLTTIPGPQTQLAAPWTGCDVEYEYFLEVFDCQKVVGGLSRPVSIYYRIDGLTARDGVPAVDVNSNGVPDAIDRFAADMTAAWGAYESWGYTWAPGSVNVFFGIDWNGQNPGVTLPFGDYGTDGAKILLPSDPGPDRYTYLAYHELFHATQYHYIPTPALLLDLPSVNWWMEATAEWAAHRAYNQLGASAPGRSLYASSVSQFLDQPSLPVNTSTWPWEAHKRQYGAFLLAQYLTEQTDQHFIRRTWEMIPVLLPLDAIASVLSGYGLTLPNQLEGFSIATYRLATDHAGLSGFVGSGVGYSDPHAPGVWASTSAFAGRPKRSAERTMSWGGTTSGSFELGPSGASYVEFTPTATGRSRITLTLQPAQGTIPLAVFRHVLVTWPIAGGAPTDTPVRWIRPDESGQISIAVDPGQMATLITTRTDIVSSSLSAANELTRQRVDWSATLAAESTTQPNTALDTMWTTRASTAGCADWSGGDAVQSTRLPSGKRAWFFSDTFLGDPAKRGAGNETSYIRNSVVVQNGTSLRTMTGGSTCRETDQSTDFWSRYAKTPAGDGGQYWTGDAKVVPGGEVIKFYYEGIGDENTRASYARIPFANLESGSVLSVTPTNLRDCSARPPYPVIWGASLLDHDGYTYIYGWEADGANPQKSLYLARTPNVSPADDLVDENRWQYFGGTSGGAAQWVGSCTGAKPLQPKTEADFSVIRLNGRFWLVHHTPGQNPGKIVAMPSSTVWGFGADTVDLYTPPEAHPSPARATVYGARVHQDILSGTGKVSVSYTVGTTAANASCFQRGYYFPDDQYPRFVDVPVTAFFSTTVL
ncbi:hypothetical protein Acor_49960 [Acrocarpospora corrugata]|uniref:Peptidase M6-like domain-containing protein n=1 Tax=Acrocarpospora corrugata TaxID=35763 RepID=A0A5M3W3W6_9ACTN|nr:hypothetical protein [Acrocarpospora corrugata]GES02930.1 hypothetical protein Acor_49960 [Acrocarpospora corrugata]